MNRVRKTSWWGAMLVGGVLLALPAAAAGKQTPDECRGQCLMKANSAMNACVETCPKSGTTDAEKEKTRTCVNRCAEKLQSSTQSCDKTCGKSKPEGH
ncbi:hypothetical protein [Archangium lipolyticum]|uniref:hypothetical protein n=1 Tax=Archangium lipolyticum TaxID=2970465 RepID=UPI00214A79EF|nr:hypothetical protein [Archangium lipolyticum]